MPELPEAETARKSLTPCVVGKTANQVIVARPNSIRTPLEDDVTFALFLKGRRIESIDRRAKALIFRFDDGSGMVFHFKLGASALCRKGHLHETDGVVLNFTDGTALEFTDLQLSEFHVAAAGELERLPVLKSGADPLSRGFTASVLKKVLPPQKQLKAALTDQENIGGIGNVYSDEILWNARISPFRKAVELSGAEWEELARQIKATLRDGIKKGGEEWFLNAHGTPGRFHPRIHKHEGDPCPRDGHSIQVVKKGRKTYWCPHCQL